VRRGPWWATAVAAGFACVAAAAIAGCQDATHDMEVAALGGENPSVPQGPLHRPGQPCLVCHGGSGPASQVFSVAGTVYLYEADTNQAGVGATVQLEDATGSAWHLTTNSAGNFFVLASDWTPTYPMSVPSVSQGSNMQFMSTLDNRAGSCASCHGLQPGPESVGPVYLAMPAPDGG
jgi:hypothetical protein